MVFGVDVLDLDFWAWLRRKLNFWTSVCQRTAGARVTTLWIKGVEFAKSIDELVTTRSNTGRPNILVFDMLDAVQGPDGFVHYEFAEWRCPRFRHMMGSCIVDSKRNAFTVDLGATILVKITKFCSTSDCDVLVSLKKLHETMGLPNYQQLKNLCKAS